MVSPTRGWRAVAWTLAIILAALWSKEFFFREPVVGVHGSKFCSCAGCEPWKFEKQITEKRSPMY